MAVTAELGVQDRNDRSTSSRLEIRQFDAVSLLTVYLGLLFFIPAVWVLPGLGAAGPPASLFGIGMFAVWCCVQLVPGISTRRTLLRWPLLLNSLALLVSYALGQDRGLSALEVLAADRALLQIVSMNGVILLASEGLPTMAHVNRLTKRITYFAGAIGVIGLIQFFLRIDPFSYLRFPGLSLNNEIASLGARGNNTLLRVKAGTLHPIEFSVVMGIALPLALHHLIHEPDRSLRWRRASLTGVIAATSLLAVSRTAVIVTAAAAIVMFWAWSPKFRLKALGFALGFLVLLRAVIPGLLGTLFFLFDNLSEDDSVTGRTDDYAIVAPLIAERPWFGRGTGTFLPEENILLDNGYLYRIITTGYVGLLTLLVLTFTALFMARHAARRHPDNRVRHLAMATAALIFAGSLSGGTFDLYAFPTANGLLSLGIGLAAGLGRMHPPISSVPGPVPRGLLQPKYRAGHVDRPWWYRFDPELRKRGGW